MTPNQFKTFGDVATHAYFGGETYQQCRFCKKSGLPLARYAVRHLACKRCCEEKADEVLPGVLRKQAFDRKMLAASRKPHYRRCMECFVVNAHKDACTVGGMVKALESVLACFDATDPDHDGFWEAAGEAMASETGPLTADGVRRATLEMTRAALRKARGE